VDWARKLLLSPPLASLRLPPKAACPNGWLDWAAKGLPLASLRLLLKSAFPTG
jgi:hypothetical protein